MKIQQAIISTGVALFATAALAQSYSIDWFAIGGGGGTSTGGVFAVSGTLGQPDANSQPMTNGNFSLTGGFWSIFAVQAPGGPLLSVERQGADVRVFWPLPATGFVLDQSLTSTGVWSQVSFPYATNATDISISMPTPTGNKFYRLRKP
jgi:hypothetical protein